MWSSCPPMVAVCVFGWHTSSVEPTASVLEVLSHESEAGLENLDAYLGFQKCAEAAKDTLLEFLLQAKRNGKLVLGYGAAAKGNTLLNYAGVKADLLQAVADRAVSKQGMFLPGSHIPVISPEQLVAQKPDSVLVLPWNLMEELRGQLQGYELITAIPELRYG